MAIRRWIVAALALSGASSVFAQTSHPAGVMVRLGAFYPSALQARNEGNNWYVIGAQVDLGSFRGMTKGKGSLALSADSMQKGNLSAIPVLLNFVTQENAIIFSVGAGASYDREARFTQAGLEKKKRFEFAWQVGVGYDLAKLHIPGQIEARYIGNGYDTLSGFAFTVGLRF